MAHLLCRYFDLSRWIQEHSNGYIYCDAVSSSSLRVSKLHRLTCDGVTLGCDAVSLHNFGIDTVDLRPSLEPVPSALLRDGVTI